jgi:predicted phage terminase large subunit-like protein
MNVHLPELQMYQTQTKPASSTPFAPRGVKEAIAAKARKRRTTQAALTEIVAHAPRRRNDLAPLLQYEMRPTGSLRPASRQVRRRDAKQSARLIASLDRFGLCRPVLISSDGTIVEGHGLWEAAKARGIEQVPCVVIDHLNANELRLLPIALNRLGETGAWDIEALRVEFAELTVLGCDLVETGFEMAEIDALTLEGGDEGEGPPFETRPFPETPTASRLGDVWILGDHRLIQGDAREASVYDRLMGRAEYARLILTDEPFNVANVGHVTGNPNHREFAMAHGEMSREEFAGFNRLWMSTALTRLDDGGLLATFIDWRSADLVVACGRDLGLSLLNILVWVKSNAGQGSLWRSQHELLPVFKKGHAPHINNVELGRHGRWRSNVWTYPGGSSLGSDSRGGLDFHPTVKPRALLEDALLDVTNRGDVVIDCFAGSGSTLLAAESVGRRCRAIEIDGPYCDVIIRRWRKMAGGEAVLEATGETLLDVLRKRLDFYKIEPAILHMKDKWKAGCVILETSGVGVAIGNALLKYEGSGRWFCYTDPKLGKVERALAQTPKIERKRVHLPISAPWLETFEAEVAAFPQSKYADQVDSMVHFLRLLDRRTRWTINLTAFRDHPEQPF